MKDLIDENVPEDTIARIPSKVSDKERPLRLDTDMLYNHIFKDH
jgi:hypothetical protein